VVRLHDWCFISIFQGVPSSPLRISDMINADPARRKKMRRAIGRMRVQNDWQSNWHGLGSGSDYLKPQCNAQYA
jgi:hypothetical protein